MPTDLEALRARHMPVELRLPQRRIPSPVAGLVERFSGLWMGEYIRLVLPAPALQARAGCVVQRDAQRSLALHLVAVLPCHAPAQVDLDPLEVEDVVFAKASLEREPGSIQQQLAFLG